VLLFLVSSMIFSFLIIYQIAHCINSY
jgi:hypothetical protein